MTVSPLLPVSDMEQGQRRTCHHGGKCYYTLQGTGETLYGAPFGVAASCLWYHAIAHYSTMLHQLSFMHVSLFTITFFSAIPLPIPSPLFPTYICLVQTCYKPRTRILTICLISLPSLCEHCFSPQSVIYLQEIYSR